MNNVLILPIIIPLLTGMFLILFKKNITLQRTLSVLSLLVTVGIAFYLMNVIQVDGMQTLNFGGWQAPFGINLAVDMLSVLLIFVAGIVAICYILFAFMTIGREREENYFYALVLFLITGVNGSFMTGDLFNLYVFFEVLLLASYVLISLGSGKIQLRESLKYIIIDILSSSFFLIGIAYLYSVTGTLNLAHLSVRVAEVGQDGMMTVIGLLFMMVFGIKAGLFLFQWLPGSYSVPPVAISALFAALLTKVGIYSILRMFTLIFYHQPQITHVALGILAALTMLLGGIGASGYWDIRKILTYNVVIGSGFILAGVATLTPEGLGGSVYYLLHDMISKSLVFLIGGAVVYLTGTHKLKEMSGLIRTHPGLGWMFFLVVMALSGMPPLSGFIGKVLITWGTFEAKYYWLGAIGLISSIMILYSLLKIFMNTFWGETVLREDEEKGSLKGIMLPLVILSTLVVALGLGSEIVQPYVEHAVTGLLDPTIYIEAVFNGNPIP